MDLQERRQLDLAERMHKVRSKARPWRAIISLVIALAAAGVAVRWGAKLHYDQYPPPGVHISDSTKATDKLITYLGAGAFCVFGIAAALGLSGKAGSALQALVGQAHAGVVRYAVLLISLFIVLVGTLQLFRVPIGQLLLGGTLVGVLVGIAAQQALGNLFAGLVLMFARPFRVGDQVRFRSGALGGMIEGTIVDISITYVRLETADGPTMVPNSQALAAASVLVKSLGPADS